MKFRLITASLVTAMAILGAGPAAASTELAQKKNCLTCHQVDKKVIGPAFKDIAAKYAGQTDAPAKLADKVIKGTTGTWGPMPMPPNPSVTADEAKALVAWLLTTK